MASDALTGRRWPPLFLVLPQGLALTVVWHAVLFAAAFSLPPLSGDRWPDLGATVINLVALLVPIAVVLWNGWWREPWFASILPRRPVLLLPVLSVASLWALPGLRGSVTTLASSALLLAVLGVSEVRLRSSRDTEADGGGYQPHDGRHAASTTGERPEPVARGARMRCYWWLSPNPLARLRA